MERDVARRIIETLRSGVATPEVAAWLPMGRERLMAEVAADLAAVARGEGRIRHVRAMAADYGDGKTHTLNAIRHLAEQERFLVTHVTLSRETTLDRGDRLYRKLVQRTYFPGVRRPGLAPLLAEIEGRPEAVYDLLRAAQERGLHPKVRAVLEARFRGQGEGADLLDGDLEGAFLSVQEVRRIFRERLNRKIDLDRFRVVNAMDYVRLLDALAVAAGLSGWVLLIDEVEMIARLGRLGRALSYAFLAEILRGEAFPHTYAVLALAKGFRSDLLEGRDEATRLPQWLSERGATALAQAVLPILDLLTEAPDLPPLRDEHLAEAFGVIAEAHSTAYDWRCPLTGAVLLRRVRASFPERDSTIRPLIRAAVQFLDLFQLYGEEPRLRVRPLTEPFVVPLDDEPDEGEGVRRDWPDR